MHIYPFVIIFPSLYHYLHIVKSLFQTLDPYKKTNTTDIYKNITCKYNKKKTTIIAKCLKWASKDSTCKVTETCS